MNGRHLITTRLRGWTILNTHAESGSRVVERDARESQLVHMSRSHELEDQGQVCVLLGDLNAASICMIQEMDTLQTAPMSDVLLTCGRTRVTT